MTASPRDDYRTPRFNIVAVIVLAIVSLLAAIGITLAFNTGGDEATLPPGYFGDVARLSQQAGDDLAAIAPHPDLRAACLADDTGAACDAYATAARAVAARLEVLTRDFGLRPPPIAAQAWHEQYRDALDDLRIAFRDQVRAIAAQRLDDFEAAAARGDEAVAREIALSDQFNIDFADQLAGSF